MITSEWFGPGKPHEAAAVIAREVLVDELHADPSQVFDLQDNYSYYLLLRVNGTDAAIGRLSYVRAGVGQIGCVAVRKNWRRQGLGDAVVKVLMYRAWDLELRHVRVLSDTENEAFFRRLGFMKTDEPLTADGKFWMERETDDGTGENCAHQCACEKGEN